MKRHYEIMRIMRTKITDSREILESVLSICYVYDAVSYRVDDLNSMLSLMSSVVWYTDLIDYRLLFSPKNGCWKTIPKLCLWYCKFWCLSSRLLYLFGSNPSLR
jgi:hypothetical protein